MSRCLAAWWAFTLIFLLPNAASAQLLNLPSPFLSGTADTWTGAEGTPHAWSAYSGLNWSPLGKLSHDGLRVRIAGGYGEYRYPARIEGRTQAVYGMSAFGDLLLGYQMGFDRLTLKAFAGATFDGHLLTPFDEASKVNMAATGAKFVVESWLNISPSTWAQLDLSYATAHAS